MKKTALCELLILVACIFILAVPSFAQAVPEAAKASPPPVAPQLVREGTFAVSLQSALNLGEGEDEPEAESRLAVVGIMPRNGWIADYPVTPDVFVELQKAVAAAADAGKLSMDKEEALQELNDINAEFSMPIKPYAQGKNKEAKPKSAVDQGDAAAINNYYTEQGPPVVTYYTPPAEYNYLYAWVPSPFWWYDFWFPGFFILNDFHRTVLINHRVVFVSNHFNDFRSHRVFRVDPGSRFRGRTFAGIGAGNRRGFIATGVRRSERTIFNGPRTRTVPGARMIGPATRGGRMTGPAPHRGGGASERGERRR